MAGTPQENPIQSDADHDRRASIIGFIDQVPGATVKEVSSHLGCVQQTATYHLRILVRSGLVVMRRDGRSCRHFLPHQLRDPEVVMEYLMRDKRRARVIRALASASRDPRSINQLSEQSGQPFAFCKGLAIQLQAHGLARVERRHVYYGVQATEALRRKVPLDFDDELASKSGIDNQGRIPAGIHANL